MMEYMIDAAKILLVYIAVIGVTGLIMLLAIVKEMKERGLL